MRVLVKPWSLVILWSLVVLGSMVKLWPLIELGSLVELGSLTKVRSGVELISWSWVCLWRIRLLVLRVIKVIWMRHSEVTVVDISTTKTLVLSISSAIVVVRW